MKNNSKEKTKGGKMGNGRIILTEAVGEVGERA